MKVDTLETAPFLLETAKVRILQAAECLFARNSIEAVPFRQIALAAGHRNVNAVQYHFGNRENLLQAIFAWRVAQMEKPRAAILERYRMEGKELGFEELLRALCEPVLDLTSDDGLHTYAAFMCQYLLYHRPLGMVHASDILPNVAQNLNRIQDRIRSRLGDVAPQLFDRRVALAYLMVMNAIVTCDTSVVGRPNPQLLRDEFDLALVMAAASLEAAREYCSGKKGEAALPKPECG